MTASRSENKELAEHEHGSAQTAAESIFKDGEGVFYDPQNIQDRQSALGSLIILLVLCKQNSAYNV